MSLVNHSSEHMGLTNTFICVVLTIFISVLPGKEVRAIDKDRTGFPRGEVEGPAVA